MFVPRPTSPLSCEPFPAIPSEDVSGFSDSEDELDDAARAAKRRRIEKLGKDYLQGKQLAIFTASLKGPFEDGWVNPWRRTRSRKTQRASSTTTATNGARAAAGVNKLETVPKRTRRDSRQDSRSVTRGSPLPPLSRGKLHVSDSDTAQGQRSNEQQRVASRRDRSSSHISNRMVDLPALNSREDGPGTSNERRKANHIRYSDTEWLKKDGKRLHRRVVDPPRSPSPTPASRPASRQKSGPEDLQAQKNQENNGAGHVIRSPTAGFTPINGYSPTSKAHTSIRPNSASAEKASTAQCRNPTSRNQSEQRKSSSKFSKPLAPASAKPRKSESKAGRKDPRSSSAPHATSTNSVQYDHPEDSNNTKTRQPQPLQIPTKGNHKSENAPGHREVHETDIVISKGHSKPKSKASSRHSSYTLNSTTTESGNIPSAQILSEHTKFSDIPMSLASTGPAGSAKGSGEVRTGPEMGDKNQDPSNQTAALQNASRDGNASPERPTADHFESCRTSVQITPFHTFSTGSAHSESHTMANSGAAKNAASAALGEETSPRRIELGEAKNAGVTLELSTDSRAKAQPARTMENETVPVHSPVGKLQTHTSAPPAGNGSYQSSGTALPFTLTMSTNGTRRQQDGQGNAADFDEFDLKEALRDAGTFLESYRIDKDTNFQSHKDTSSQGRAVQPAVGANKS